MGSFARLGLTVNRAPPHHRLALPRSVKHWPLATLREKLIKTGAKVITRARYVVFWMVDLALPKRLFRAILERIRRLRMPETVPG